MSEIVAACVMGVVLIAHAAHHVDKFNYWCKWRAPSRFMQLDIYKAKRRIERVDEAFKYSHKVGYAPDFMRRTRRARRMMYEALIEADETIAAMRGENK